MPLIKLDEVCKRYGDKVIFDKLNISVDAGEYIAITGESGKGKTTLLNIIGLIESIDSGKLEICGISNPNFHTRSGIMLLRNKISYLFQNFGLIEDKSVTYNMTLATRFLKCSIQSKTEMISVALENMGLKGYENKRIFELSGGEQQRVALAKILIKPSEIILADEPTGSLDYANRDSVMNMLAELNRNGKAIILVTHDLTVAQCCKRIISL